MTLLEQIQIAQLNARKSRIADEVSTLTTLLSEATNVGKNKNRLTTDEETIKVVKNTMDNIVFCVSKTSNTDRLTKYHAELTVLRQFLPKQMNEQDIDKVLTNMKAQNPGLKLPQVMAYFKLNFPGQYDGGKVKFLTETFLMVK